MRRFVYGHVHYSCKNCGDMYEAKSRNYKPTCSDECAKARWRESVKSITNKIGPMYGKWLINRHAAKMRQQAKKGG